MPEEATATSTLDARLSAAEATVLAEISRTDTKAGHLLVAFSLPLAVLVAAIPGKPLPGVSAMLVRGILISNDAWIMLQKAGNAPQPRHYALNGRLPLWHVDDLDAYANRDYERWPISRVAEYLGYQGASATGSARKQLSRWGLYAVDRAPGRGGEARFAADQVQAAHAARPGKGRHGAARGEAGKFVSGD